MPSIRRAASGQPLVVAGNMSALIECDLFDMPTAQPPNSEKLDLFVVVNHMRIEANEALTSYTDAEKFQQRTTREGFTMACIR